MILSTLLNIATTITISSLNPTTMVFSDPVEFVSIGKTGDFSFFINNSKRVIVIQPLKEMKKAEMIVVTENKNYQFKIHVESSGGNNYYQIQNGVPNGSFTLLKKTDIVDLYEGSSSMMIKNNRDKEIIVNDEVLKGRDSRYLPKGSALYINNEKVL